MAFGTGTHFTTLSCLELFEDWLDAAPRPRPLRVLDVGTGTGILAIGALLLGADSALGIDVDPVAVNEAQENAARNGMADRIRNRVEPLERHETPAEVVFANILGPTIVRLADALADAVAPGGVIFCSGILATQERNVQRALARRGLARFDRRRDGEWVSLAFVRR
jgi:ribosomal protein L11 methyltransferase